MIIRNEQGSLRLQLASAHAHTHRLKKQAAGVTVWTALMVLMSAAVMVVMVAARAAVSLVI